MSEQTATQRLDKWLWYARFFKTRSLCAKAVTGGLVRVNATKTVKASHSLTVGDTLTFAQANHIRVVTVRGLGIRRGPAVQAQALYNDLTPLPDPSTPDGTGTPTARKGRPTKRDRRAILAFRRSPLE